MLVGATPVALPFQFKDGWFFSVGAEYMWSPALTLRGGVGFEKSPITDDVRMPLLPDNDRLWLSAGGTYQWSPKISFDLAYSHLFVKSTPINITAASGNPWFTGVSLRRRCLLARRHRLGGVSLSLGRAGRTAAEAGLLQGQIGATT